jgi:hypothetical protein
MQKMSYKIELPWPELRPLFRYINEIMGCKCFPDLLELGIYPNAKEITESLAAYSAARKYGKKLFPFEDRKTSMISVGDGASPRTAAMFAFRSAWQCYSIDPNLKHKANWKRIKRLVVMPNKIEDLAGGHFCKLVLAAVHSHAPLDVACEKFTADKRMVVAIPCCVPQVRERPPDIEYIDKGIWSPENKVQIWID